LTPPPQKKGEKKCHLLQKKNNSTYNKSKNFFKSEDDILPGRPLKLADIGAADYPTISKFVKHSCDPTAVKVFLGNQVSLSPTIYKQFFVQKYLPQLISAYSLAL